MRLIEVHFQQICNSTSMASFCSCLHLPAYYKSGTVAGGNKNVYNVRTPCSVPGVTHLRGLDVFSETITS